MNILVCNAQVPFIRGGAEMLAEALVAALRARGHRTDLVAVPYKWYPLDEIFKSALAWRLLDLSESNGTRVDRIIATKFPSYAAQHSHKVIWLVHQFRQAYDWYGTPLSDLSRQPEARRAREEIVALDTSALGEAQARYAISKNVAGRLKKFNGLDATPLYPPPRLAGKFRVGDYGDYILYLGRLDRAKRVDLLIRALARVKGGRAIIAGTGAEMTPLQKLAQDCGVSDRVEFTGYVDDARAIELYANARAVFYAPVDEDYGFATVEALMSARPVITTEDAGGVLEFVEHEADGLVTSPKPEAVASAISRVWTNTAQCREWGRAGQARVRGITWENVVEKLAA
jgi:glycosyltransferase involved in cell wall biosynthesis